MGLIRRSFAYLDCDIFKRLFTTFVRPHLEYAQSVWSPHLSKLINQIENVQIRATNLVDGLSKLEYEERLRKLDMTTLKFRRLRGDMIQLYRHFHSYDRGSLSNSFQPSARLSRKHGYQLVRLKPNDGTRGFQTNSFYFRTTKTWNDLPRDVVSAPTIDTFKKRLDDAWENHPTKYNHITISTDS